MSGARLPHRVASKLWHNLLALLEDELQGERGLRARLLALELAPLLEVEESDSLKHALATREHQRLDALWREEAPRCAAHWDRLRCRDREVHAG